MPFPPKSDDKKDDRSAPTSDHTPNDKHNAPMSDNHKAELAKHDIAVSPGHTNHGPGHH